MATSNWIFGNIDDFLKYYGNLDTKSPMYQIPYGGMFIHKIDSERRLVINHSNDKDKLGFIAGHHIQHISREKDLTEQSRYLVPINNEDITLDIKHKKIIFKKHKWLFWKTPLHIMQIDRIYGNPPHKINCLLVNPFFDHVSNRLCWVMPYSGYQ